MANTENATVAPENGNGKVKRVPIRMETAEEFFDDIPEAVKLSRGRGQDLTVFSVFVKYIEDGAHDGGKGKARRIRFVDSDAAKQKAGQLRTAMVEGKYPVPDGWEWHVAARPIVVNGKSIGSELYYQTAKKLAKSAKGKATTTDVVVKRPRKSKKNDENPTAE